MGDSINGICRYKLFHCQVRLFHEVVDNPRRIYSPASYTLAGTGCLQKNGPKGTSKPGASELWISILKVIGNKTGGHQEKWRDVRSSQGS